eukprot:756479-Hanusia_phi.AAC.2
MTRGFFQRHRRQRTTVSVCATLHAISGNASWPSSPVLNLLEASGVDGCNPLLEDFFAILHRTRSRLAAEQTLRPIRWLFLKDCATIVNSNSNHSKLIRPWVRRRSRHVVCCVSTRVTEARPRGGKNSSHLPSMLVTRLLIGPASCGSTAYALTGWERLGFQQSRQLQYQPLCAKQTLSEFKFYQGFAEFHPPANSGVRVDMSGTFNAVQLLLCID